MGAGLVGWLDNQSAGEILCSLAKGSTAVSASCLQMQRNACDIRRAVFFPVLQKEKMRYTTLTFDPRTPTRVRDSSSMVLLPVHMLLVCI